MSRFDGSNVPARPPSSLTCLQLEHLVSSVPNHSHPNILGNKSMSFGDSIIASTRSASSLPTLPTEIKFMILNSAPGDQTIRSGACKDFHRMSRRYHPFIENITNLPPSIENNVDFSSITTVDRSVHTVRHDCNRSRCLIRNFSLNLLWTNREMYNEGRKILYSTNVFMFYRTDHLHNFVKKLRPHNRSLLRSIGLGEWPWKNAIHSGRVTNLWLSNSINLLPHALATFHFDLHFFVTVCMEHRRLGIFSEVSRRINGDLEETVLTTKDGRLRLMGIMILIEAVATDVTQFDLGWEQEQATLVLISGSGSLRSCDWRE